MSQIIKRALLFPVLLLLPILIFSGCGSSNSQSSLDPVTGQHPAGWLPAGHMTAAKADVENCAQCHGADYSGGISKVACTDCHMGNQQSIHPASWGSLGYILHAGYVNTNGNSECANALCHGTNLDGVGAAGPSCTSCHMGGVNSIHPTYWKSLTYALHGGYVSSNSYDASSCANARCHGTNLDGVSAAGPSCTSCHIGGAYAVHPVAWKTDITLHKTYFASDSISCKNVVCHGANYEGVYLSGPSCYFCHKM